MPAKLGWLRLENFLFRLIKTRLGLWNWGLCLWPKKGEASLSSASQSWKFFSVLRMIFRRCWLSFRIRFSFCERYTSMGSGVKFSGSDLADYQEVAGVNRNRKQYDIHKSWMIENYTSVTRKPWILQRGWGQNGFLEFSFQNINI